ncbi:MAG: DUF4870 domain-containing protein [Phycisphaerae bacterium]|jgi:hypothetical protein
MIQFKCAKCGEAMEAADSSAGSNMPCAKCGNVNAVPLPSAAEPVAAGVAAAQPLSEGEKNARMWGMFCHLAAMAGFVFPFIGAIVGPLVIWLIKGNEHPFIDANGKNSLNFQISMVIYGLLSIPLWIIFIGIFTLAAVVIVDVVCVIIATIKANEGETFKYPLTIRFVK